LFNTMTPDHLFPGSAPLLAAKLGCNGVPALDLRTQCAAMILRVSGCRLAAAHRRGARRILIVGAEAHAALMPWEWDVLDSNGEKKAVAGELGACQASPWLGNHLR
jgi:3-oxoacyl-[acyl-carrier-protein] synthase-3